MSIDNLPPELVKAVQTGFLAREFERGLTARLGFRNIADKETFPNNIGDTLTRTRMGLKPAVTSPLNPAQNTNFDNGLTSSSQDTEQYTYGIDQYGDTIDLNQVTSQVMIGRLFVQNAHTNGEQAARSLDGLARDTLFYGPKNPALSIGGYLGGNTRVTQAATGSSTTLAVDDIRGFQCGYLKGSVVAIGPALNVQVYVNNTPYTLVAAIADSVSTSTAPYGVSGTLQFSAQVQASDGALGASVVHASAPKVVRPNNKQTTAALTAGGVSKSIDTLTVNDILAAIGELRANNVPEVNGLYMCYISTPQLNGLFRDPDFKLLYRGQYNSDTYRTGQVFDLLGVRFVPTTQTPQQASLGAGKIHRAILVGEGALIEGSFEGTGHTDIARVGSDLVHMVDGVAMVTRPPVDRLQQIIAQSWYWIGGYALPTDTTATPDIIGTATNSYLKRAVVLESLGTDMNYQFTTP